MYLNILKPFSLLFFFLILISYSDVVAQTCTATIATDGRTELCQGESTELKANTGTGFTYRWFRDGTLISGSTGPTLQASIAGVYQVEVTGPNCTANLSSGTTISVDPRPAPPGFTITPTTVPCSGTPLTFAVNAPSPDLIYIWSFGDGETARGPEVSHTYDVKGTGVETYPVSVFATSAKSCESETVTKDVQVKRMPEISFTEKTEFITCLPDTVAAEDISVTAEITNTTQDPYLTDIRSYSVNWGDGSNPITYRPSDFPISNPTPYTAEGEYEIVITALAGNGCTETFTQVYSVSKEPKAGFEIDKKREVETQMPPCVPVIVTPTDTAAGSGLTYRWLIQPEQGWTIVSGDTNAADPVFKFTESGVYTIEQIVTNACASDTASQSIIVGWPQVQPPTGGTFCGPTPFRFSGSGPAGAGGGPGSIMIDKNLGEKITVNVKITGPKSFSRTFTSESFNFDFDFSLPGKYTLTVEAINECGSSNQVTGGQATPVEFIILKQPTAPTVQTPGVVCEGDVVTLTASGTGPVFAWYDSDAPGATPLQEGPSTSFTTPALPAGEVTYFVRAINNADSVECQSEPRPVVITVRDRIGNNTIEGEDSRSICKGGTIAELTGTTPTGGDPAAPYTYTWIQSTTGPDNGFTAASGTNNNINFTPGPITATTWFRRVVSSASCTPDTSNVIQVIAVDPVPAAANTIGPAQDICEGDVPKQLVGSQPTGGAGAPYTFLWEVSRTGATTGFTPAAGPNTGANYTIQSLEPGDTWFRRQVTSGGCTTPSEAVKITLSPRLANNTITPAEQSVCAGVPLAALTGSAPTGGKGSYQYEWFMSPTGAEGTFSAIPNSNTQSYTPGSLTETTYFRRVVTSGSCGANTSTAVVVRIKPAVTGNSVSAPQEVCAGVVPNELIGSSPSGGNGSFTYRWESSTAGPNTNFTPATAPNSGQNYSPTALTKTTWFRRVAISDGCESPSEAVAITVLPLPAPPTLAVKNATTCTGGTATLTVNNTNGNTYKWYAEATGGESIGNGPIFVTPELFQNTTYYVEAISDKACASSTRTAATVTIVEPVADAGPDVTIIQGGTIALRVNVEGGKATTYLWEPALGLSDPTSGQPVASPEETTTYTVTVTTAEGCVATDEVTVTVIPAIKIPNAFTPNRDGVNETWEIENIGEYPEVRVEIFNRWGNLVFTSNGYGEPWDGTLKGSDLPVATYYYMIYLNKDIKPISGHVTIIR